jgi:sarcosine oxidase subunit alpha
MPPEPGRLPPRAGERIDRDRPLRFSFEDTEMSGFAGDTVGSALFAAGRRVFSRSFKYHRPRGLFCCTGGCPNCLMTVDGVPNVRACVEPLTAGARVEAQNVLGSLDRDWLSIVDRIGGPFTPVGFYYRTMIRPRRLWPVYERGLRHLAGLGRVGETGERRYDAVHRQVEVLVIGGGRSGREAAGREAAAGADVLLVDEEGRDLGDAGFPVLAPARALGVFEGGLVPVDAGGVLHRIRARRLVVATGAVEQPLVFPGNDLVGVMLPSAARRLVGDWSIRPGAVAVVVAADDRSLEAAAVLEDAGVRLAALVDLRVERPSRLAAVGRGGRVASVVVEGRRFGCDLLVACGVRQPAYSLLAQAGARVEYDPARGIFVPRDLPDGVVAVGAAAAELPAAEPVAASYGGGSERCFVCLCEDVGVKDLRRAVAEGFDSIELAKRYTTVTMGPCQGRLCQLASIRLLARETSSGEEAIGTTTARPPWAPVELGLLAGRHHEPARRSPLQPWHDAAGATMVWAGAWRRALHYGDPRAEVRAVHGGLGVIDVSSLGKLLVEGGDAAAFLERLYPNRFADLGIGRVRYGVTTTDGGRILDDGTVARLDPERFYVTTTSTGSDQVQGWFEWWNAVWGYDVAIAQLTGALAAINLAGPRAREALESLTDEDVSAEAFRYLDAREIRVAGVPCLALRIGFVGELGYELHCPASAAPALWRALVAAGATAFGLEAQRVLRLEKAHVIVGQDTDSESTLVSAGMGWLIKDDKPDFIGKWAAELQRQRGPRERLVGFTMEPGRLPLEGAQIVRDGRPAGRVTSARDSELLGHVVGLAWVEPDQAHEGASISVRIDGELAPATVTLSPFFDPEGTRVRA